MARVLLRKKFGQRSIFLFIHVCKEVMLFLKESSGWNYVNTSIMLYQKM